MLTNPHIFFVDMDYSYEPNANGVERLHWYKDNDIQGGYVLAQVLDLLEECWSIDVTFD